MSALMVTQKTKWSGGLSQFQQLKGNLPTFQGVWAGVSDLGRAGEKIQALTIKSRDMSPGLFIA